MNKYRNRLQIMRDILLVVVSEDGSKKTHIMYGTTLSYKFLMLYLGEAMKAGLLEFDGESLYSITPRGLEFLKIYETYEESRKDAERHLNNLKTGREILEKMLLAE